MRERWEDYSALAKAFGFRAGVLEMRSSLLPLCVWGFGFEFGEGGLCNRVTFGTPPIMLLLEVPGALVAAPEVA